MQHAATVVSGDLEVRRQYTARLGRLVVVLNSEYTLYESDRGSGVFDRFAPLGIEPPDAAPTLLAFGSGNITGERAYLIVYVDENNDAMSNPFAPDTPVAVVASGQQVRLTFNDNPTNPLVTHRRIYRNDSDGGTTFYLVATVPLADAFYEDNITDAQIRGTLTTVERDNDVPGTGEYDFCISIKNYIFLFGKQHFIFSKPGSATAFPLRNRTPIENGTGGRIRVASPVGDILVDYKDSVVYEHRWDSMPHGLTGDGFAKTMTTDRGCLNEAALVNMRGVHYVQDRWGIYQTRGSTEENDLGVPLEGIMARINWNVSDKFSSVRTENAAYWFIALDGDIECRNALVLNLQSIRAGGPPKWHLHRYPVGIRHATRFRTRGDTAKKYGMEWETLAAFITPSGHTGYLAAGYRDFVNGEMTGEGSVTAVGSTTTFVDDAVGRVFETTNANAQNINVIGAPLRFLLPWGDAWEREFIVTGVDAGTGTVTYTPATPAAVPTGTEYVIGGIRGHIATPLVDFGDADAVKTLKAALIEYQPQGIVRELSYAFEFDRKGRRLGIRAFSESDRDMAANAASATVELGGPIEQGRLGVKSLGAPSEGFRYAQLFLMFDGIDHAHVVDAVTLELRGG
jgi:hypothetical protein